MIKYSYIREKYSMFNKLVKKLIVAASLVCMAGTVAATATACNIETDHPKVRISVEFNSQNYDLDYVLYRNMYPNTVRHFIELTENGFYNNTMVHDYDSKDWLSGGYAYNAEDYNASAAVNAYTDYLEGHSLEQSYMDLFNGGKLTPSVYAQYDYDANHNMQLSRQSALPTLIGEYKNNINQAIEKGALTAEQGTLKMYYYEKESKGKVHVTPTSDQVIWNADYSSNCATSIFSMQVGTSTDYDEANYCVFGKMESTATLTELIDAIDDYYDSVSASSLSADDVNVDNLVEIFSGETADKGLEVDFTLPALPIIIKSITVTKY